MEMMILASDWSVLTVIGAVSMVAVALLLIGLILLQKNRGSGLSGAFGGVGGHTAFGTKTGDFLTWVTVALTAVFLLLAILLNFAFEPPSMAGTAGAPAPAGTASPAAAETDTAGDSAAGTTPAAPVSASDIPAPPRGG
jgi:preprotein translocase subunit SecG